MKLNKLRTHSHLISPKNLESIHTIAEKKQKNTSAHTPNMAVKLLAIVGIFSAMFVSICACMGFICYSRRAQALEQNSEAENMFYLYILGINPNNKGLKMDEIDKMFPAREVDAVIQERVRLELDGSLMKASTGSVEATKTSEPTLDTAQYQKPSDQPNLNLEKRESETASAESNQTGDLSDEICNSWQHQEIEKREYGKDCVVCSSSIVLLNTDDDDEEKEVESEKNQEPSSHEKNHLVRMLYCGHIFHDKCISKWLTIQSICPLCRRDFKPSSVEDQPPVVELQRPADVVLV